MGFAEIRPVVRRKDSGTVGRPEDIACYAALMVSAGDAVFSAADRAGCDVLRDPEILHAYAHDESDAAPQEPIAVVRAKDAAQVAALLQAASRHGVPVTPRAAGTGRVGGAVPCPGGIVLELEGGAPIRAIEAQDRFAKVAPHCVTGHLHESVESEGLFYGPDPNSWATCQIGGNVACNAGGPRAYKYGVTSNWVLALEVVTGEGQILQLGRNVTKQVTGYDLRSLMVGSGGTLGVITDVSLRLQSKPESVGTLSVFLRRESDLSEVGRRLRMHGLQPRCLEFLDMLALDVLVQEGALERPEGAAALAIVEFDGTAVECSSQVERAGNVLMDFALHVNLASADAEREALWAPRRQMSRLLRKRAKAKLSEDIVVPASQVGALLERARADAEREHVRIATYGHAGDGNLHVNFLYDDADEKRRVDRCVHALFEHTVDLGGVLSGEHGIGLTKAPFLRLEQSDPLIAIQRSLKNVFDPANILNPGKILATRVGHGSC